jgi:lipoprotein lipase
LDASDAHFVDVIHTAGKWVGNEEVIGHVDFFPNGGRAPQPGIDTTKLCFDQKLFG